MKLNRIWAIMLRHLLGNLRSFDKIIDSFYWPFIDLLTWGLTGFYISSQAGGEKNIIVVLLCALIYWVFVLRGQYDVSGLLLEDIWARNLVNIFISPIKFSEWVAALMIMGVIKGLLVLLFGWLLALFMYGVNIMVIGWTAIPVTLILLMTGWVIGIFVAGVIMRFGTKFQSAAWSVVWIFSPFSAVYFPVDILPQWAQAVSKFVPSSYAFEMIRTTILKGNFDINSVWLGMGLSIFYFVLALIFLHRSYKYALRQGLNRLI